ncbi:hypothetical protein ARMGADRAFT_1012833 [Armillaria gallica]|uniref:SH3 domain-containing protein n=1 Tax=Armillaria gallica TaxID=47427 RepID=A0A2H3DNW2_ARMGA|nr:hypothetical protein ARMGADRAFT_1012833 [Armillaria gallica]
MPSSPQQRLPAERVRHRKRAPLPQIPVEPRDEEEYTSSAVPITTITITREESSTASSATSLSTTATTTRSSTTSSLSSSAPSSSSSSSSVSSVAESTLAGSSSSESLTTPPLPSASAIASTPASASDVQQNGAASKQTLSAGAIAGIVIAVVLVLVAVALILLRNRFMQRRRSRVSTWISRPRLANTGLAFDPASDTYNDGPQSSGMQFNQSGAMATPLTMPSASWNNAGISPSTIPPPSSAIVKSRFIPSLLDELPISNGETIRILQEFDDGWALCANGREEQGMVPLECLERLTPTSGLPATTSELRNSARESSLYGLNPVRR